MFTDILGYTALMGGDEDKGYCLLKQNRNIQKPLIEKHRSRFFELIILTRLNLGK